MKIRITTALIAFALSLQAQIEPYDQFFYRSIWKSLPKFDSVTVWIDTISPTNIYGSYSIELLPNGMIDTMFFMDARANDALYQYSGQAHGDTHIVISNFKLPQGLLPYQRTTYTFDGQGRHEWVYQDDYNGFDYEKYSQTEVRYLPNGDVDMLVIGIYNGVNYTPGGSTKYHYTNAVLDSVIHTDYTSQWGNVKFIPKYSSNGQLRVMEYYEHVSLNSGLTCTQRDVFIYNGSEIKFRLAYYFDFTDKRFYLGDVMEFSVNNKYPVSRPEYSLQTFMVYPNPAINEINIDGKNLDTYTLYDFKGTEIMKGKSDGKIDLSSIRKGTYLLHISDEEGNAELHKIVKL